MGRPKKVKQEAEKVEAQTNDVVNAEADKKKDQPLSFGELLKQKADERKKKWLERAERDRDKESE